ncbi:short transient receptor potential channel 4-like [Glandiceps talaboti]
MSFIRKDYSVEKLFLSAAERGDKKAIIYALENGRRFNVNCKDSEGRTALVLAIQNGSTEIIKVLLDYGVELGDSLLVAVDDQFTTAVQIICDYIEQFNVPEYLYCRSLNGDLHPDITPIILAAHHNNYDIIKILLDQGVKIEDPDYYCFQTENFTLQNSLGMINVYRALASQAYISLTSDDPINTAFELSLRLQNLSKSDYEFRYTYEELADQCEQFASDLLGHIRDSSEQEVVLNHDPEEWAYLGDKYIGQPSKVKRAIKCKQKKFVAHPHCQQHLIERWYHGLPGWRKQNPWKRGLYTLLIGLSFPLLNLMYLVCPHWKLSKLLKIPYVKFVCLTASNLAFLVFLAMQAMEFGRNIGNSNVTVARSGCHRSDSFSIMNVTFSEWLVVIWVLGFTVNECQEIWQKGMKTVSDNWSIKLFDFFTMSLYWTWITLRFSICLENQSHSHLNITQPETVEEETTDIGNQTLALMLTNFHEMGMKLDTLTQHVQDISRDQNDIPWENITALLHSVHSNVLDGLGSGSITEKTHSIVKRAARATARRRVGPGSSSGGSSSEGYYESARVQWNPFDPGLIAESLFAIAKVLSFLRLIRITVVNVQLGPMQISLSRMAYDIIRFLAIFCLVWFAFSVGLNQLYWFYAYEKKEFCVKNPKTNTYRQDCDQAFGSILDAMMTLFWALFGIADMEKLKIEGANHWFTEGVGKVLFAAYHVIGIVVLLNILIAMMSNTFTRIEEDADMQWKFSRSCLWMNFFDELSTLTPPFNMLPTSDLWYRYCKCKKNHKIKRPSVRTREKNYQVVAQQLIRRYLFDLRRGDDDDSQDPMRIFRQELSNFKYEMFEALSDMELKIKEIKLRLDTAERTPPPKLGYKPKFDEPGSEMFHALKDTLSPPTAIAERTPPSPTESSSVSGIGECVFPDALPKPAHRQTKVSFEDEMENGSYLSIEQDMNLSDLETPLFTTSGSESILGDLHEPIPRDYPDVFNHNLPRSLRVPNPKYSSRRWPSKKRRSRQTSDPDKPRTRYDSNESLDGMFAMPRTDPIILGTPQPERKALTAMVKNMAGIALMPLSERWGPMKFIDDHGHAHGVGPDKHDDKNATTGNYAPGSGDAGTMV